MAFGKNGLTNNKEPKILYIICRKDNGKELMSSYSKLQMEEHVTNLAQRLNTELEIKERRLI